ncbi:P-loop containing nucleoside triphosphate hydrolase protein [Lentinula raphanica]|uniref:RNA helicase n=1 Tax=Lentinula raphanica TaxID=153919 RepID=A0AA38UC25_9AGAR|nr:P-loop containing nucleoside triphosphate hydrolase protein [Lentinula raphanica]
MVDAHLVDTKSKFSSFSHLLDARILQALADMGFARPTLVQSKTIPLALESRDILARARTGSGKTAAYGVPVVQKILSGKGKGKLAFDSPDLPNQAQSQAQATRALILVPTRELSEQVTSYMKGLCKYCEDSVVVVNAAGATSGHLQRTLLSDRPDIVIATPARALALLQSKSLTLTHLDSLVIDEADLVLAYGHDSDIRQILQRGVYLPKVYQSFLMSATMTEDVEMLKGLLTLRNPAILKLEDSEDEAARLTQYSVRCTEPDKFLLTYIILKLKLIRGKAILFVNDVDRSYRLKLFLEQFSIRSCVLNSELPLNMRYHTVQEFNKGVYDYIIATDESGLRENDDDNADDDGENDEDEDENEDEDEDDREEEDEVGEEFTSTQQEAPSTSQTKPRTKLPESSESYPSDPSRERERKRKRGQASPDEPDSAPSSSQNQTQTQKDPKPSTSTLTSKSTSTSKSSKSSNPTPQHSQTSKPKKTSTSSKEYGVTRGIDFIDVACVLNFDLPSSSRAYTHRVGRTARAGRTGMALSFIVPSPSGASKTKQMNQNSNKLVGIPGNDLRDDDERVFGRIEKDQAARGSKILEYKFDMGQVDAFRYRMEDALRAVTRVAVREARVRELKEEVVRSERMKAHFEDNPLDLEYLRHDKPLHPTRVQPHMKHVPGYLMPRTAVIAEEGADGDGGQQVGFVPFKKPRTTHSHFRGRGGGGIGGRGGKKKSDPLKRFGK